MNKRKLALIIFAIILIGSFFYFDLGKFLSFEYLKSQKDLLTDYYQANSTLVIVSYMVIYIAVTALSLPGAAIMTLAGGAIFGFALGTVLVSFASTIGATLAFLVARYLLGDYVQKSFGDKLSKINKGIEDEGAYYLFTLRLIPAFPFFVINLVMGLTPMKTFTFFWVSQIGMLAGTMVYVNAGTQLGKLESISGILSPELIGSFVLLGIFPLATKKIMSFIKAKRSHA